MTVEIWQLKRKICCSNEPLCILVYMVQLMHDGRIPSEMQRGCADCAGMKYSP